MLFLTWCAVNEEKEGSKGKITDVLAFRLGRGLSQCPRALFSQRPRALSAAAPSLVSLS